MRKKVLHAAGGGWGVAGFLFARDLCLVFQKESPPLMCCVR
jgi:hypothetical protein